MSTDRLAVTTRRLSTVLPLIVVAACQAPAPAGPAPTPAPIVTQAPVVTPVAGSGVITFGRPSALDDDTLLINPSRDTFDVGTKKIAWSAHLSGPAEATKLTIIIAKVSGSGTERQVYTEKVPVSNPEFDILAADGDLAALVGRKPGTYVMRILRGATVLAEGKFKLVK